MVKVCKQQKIPLINLVRRQEQVELLKSLGAEMVINTSEPNWEQELKELAHKLQANVCFEAVSGDMTGRILNVLPRGGVVYLYGALSEQPACAIDPIQTIFRHKRLQGWILGNYLKTKSLFGLMGLVKKVQALLLDDTMKSDVAERITLDQIKDSIPKYLANMTAGKFLIYPNKV